MKIDPKEIHLMINLHALIKIHGISVSRLYDYVAYGVRHVEIEGKPDEKTTKHDLFYQNLLRVQNGDLFI